MSEVWPTRKDSNLRPSESESDALSSCATGRYEIEIDSSGKKPSEVAARGESAESAEVWR